MTTHLGDHVSSSTISPQKLFKMEELSGLINTTSELSGLHTKWGMWVGRSIDYYANMDIDRFASSQATLNWSLGQVRLFWNHFGYSYLIANKICNNSGSKEKESEWSWRVIMSAVSWRHYRSVKQCRINKVVKRFSQIDSYLYGNTVDSEAIGL